MPGKEGVLTSKSCWSGASGSKRLSMFFWAILAKGNQSCGLWARQGSMGPGSRSYLISRPTPLLSVGFGPKKARNSLLVKMSRSQGIAKGTVYVFMAYLMAAMRPSTSESLARNPISWPMCHDRCTCLPPCTRLVSHICTGFQPSTQLVLLTPRPTLT